MRDEFDTEEFYNLMQNYRHAPLADQQMTIEAFEAVKAFARYMVRQARQENFEMAMQEADEVDH